MATKKKSNPAPTVAAYDDTKWRAREDMHTLARAKEIEADRSRLSAAKREAQAEMKKIQSIVRTPARGRK